MSNDNRRHSRRRRRSGYGTLTLPDVLSDVHGVDEEDGGEVRVYGLRLWLVRSRNDIGEFCSAGGGLDFDGLRHLGC